MAATHHHHIDPRPLSRDGVASPTIRSGSSTYDPTAHSTPQSLKSDSGRSSMHAGISSESLAASTLATSVASSTQQNSKTDLSGSSESPLHQESTPTARSSTRLALRPSRSSRSSLSTTPPNIPTPVLPPTTAYLTTTSPFEPGAQIAAWRTACAPILAAHLTELPGWSPPTDATSPSAAREAARTAHTDALCAASPHLWPALLAACYALHPELIPRRGDDDWDVVEDEPSNADAASRSARQKRIVAGFASPPRVLARQQAVFGALAVGGEFDWSNASRTTSDKSGKDGPALGPRGEDENGDGEVECRCRECRGGMREKVKGWLERAGTRKGRGRARTVASGQPGGAARGSVDGAQLRPVKTKV